MENIFQYPDSNSSRAKIEYLNRKFLNQKIAIIGLGGTGSYILDFVSKTPVKEIHLFDNDDFELHNAFRAPGAIDQNRWGDTGQLKKVFYFEDTYSKMHKGIIAHDERVTANNMSQFKDFDFVFMCVDDNAARCEIASELNKLMVAFVDVGLGVQVKNDHLVGMLRTTLSTTEKNDHLAVRFGSEAVGENDYTTNIQIAELNALNAVFAVMKWKKHINFYHDQKNEHNTFFVISTNKTINEDYKA